MYGFTTTFTLPQVENPIAFSSSPLSRTLSTLHLHSRYALLLVWPQHLSADWSFACIPLVEGWEDPRNLLSLLLYSLVLLAVVLAKPWGLITGWTNAEGSERKLRRGEMLPICVILISCL